MRRLLGDLRKKTIKMTFEQILESEFRYLVEGIEHGSSDPELIEMCIKELQEKTGYKSLSLI